MQVQHEYAHWLRMKKIFWGGKKKTNNNNHNVKTSGICLATHDILLLRSDFFEVLDFLWCQGCFPFFSRKEPIGAASRRWQPGSRLARLAVGSVVVNQCMALGTIFSQKITESRRRRGNVTVTQFWLLDRPWMMVEKANELERDLFF